MSLTPVKSSNIKAVGYDPGSKALRVEFNSGAQHRYEEVSPEKHAGMMAADSVGSYFHAHIRGAHKSSKVES
jgi:hypothetical protein